MVEVGYTPAYAKSYCGKMWENIGLLAAIKRIDDKIVAEMDLSRKAQYQRLLDIYDKTTSDSVKVACLREMNEMLGYHRDKAPNTEKEQARLERLSTEERKLARTAAKMRTDELSEASIKLVKGA